MKTDIIDAKNREPFKPLTIKITFETAEEAMEFHNRIGETRGKHCLDLFMKLDEKLISLRIK